MIVSPLTIVFHQDIIRKSKYVREQLFFSVCTALVSDICNHTDQIMFDHLLIEMRMVSYLTSYTMKKKYLEFESLQFD